MNLVRVRNLVFWVLALAVLAGGAYYIYQHRPAGLPAGFASGNGRLEATEVDVATKIAGRLAELGPREGDWVEAGAVVRNCVLLLAAMVVVINFIVDVLYAAIDPRIEASDI